MNEEELKQILDENEVPWKVTILRKTIERVNEGANYHDLVLDEEIIQEIKSPNLSILKDFYDAAQFRKSAEKYLTPESLLNHENDTLWYYFNVLPHETRDFLFDLARELYVRATSVRRSELFKRPQFFLISEPNGRKTTFCTLLSEILSNWWAPHRSEDFSNYTNDATLLIYDEFDASRLKANTLKVLAQGGKTTLDVKCGRPIEKDGYPILILTANEPPNYSGPNMRAIDARFKTYNLKPWRDNIPHMTVEDLQGTLTNLMKRERPTIAPDSIVCEPSLGESIEEIENGHLFSTFTPYAN
jgi:hypothetical protein